MAPFSLWSSRQAAGHLASWQVSISLVTRQAPFSLCKRNKHIAASSSQAGDGSTAQQIHAKAQRAVFDQPDVVQQFLAPLPADVDHRLAEILQLLPGLDGSKRIIDVGSGTGCLIPHLRARGVKDILAVDLSPVMLQQLAARYPPPSTVGNDSGVRTWAGDFLDLPNYLGPVAAITMNAVFGNFSNLHEALLKASMLLQPGGHLLISHPLGRAWHSQLHQDSAQLVPHELPDAEQLQQLTHNLPLQVVEFVDKPQLYAAVLQVPPGYRMTVSPLVMQSTVVKGFGRGSRQLGVPTANMDPRPLQEQLQQLPQGVYFGWAQLDAPAGWPAADGAVHKMVMNVGRRPTVNAGDEAATVEVHILHSYSQDDFYGTMLRVVALGFVRPEIKFTGLQQLLARIKTDIGIAKSQLDEPAAAAFKTHRIFRQKINDAL